MECSPVRITLRSFGNFFQFPLPHLILPVFFGRVPFLRCAIIGNVLNYFRIVLSSLPQLFMHAFIQSFNISIYPNICLTSVDVRRLQVVILALSPRKMSQTDRILPRYILSRVRVSVRPRIFLYAKKTQTTVARRQLGGVAVTRRAVNYDVTLC